MPYSLSLLTLLMLFGFKSNVRSEPEISSATNMAVNDSITTANWMKYYADDNQLISSLSIPGTHESGATGGMMILNADKCQSESIEKQLNDGIRYLDIRLKLKNNQLLLYHGSIYQGWHFKNYVAKPLIDFLRDNPSEFVLMQIKCEDKTENSTKTIYQAILDAMGEERELLYLNDTMIPNVGDVRGRVVVLRRDDDVPAELMPFGLSLKFNNNNQTDSQCSNKQLHVQDYYNHKWSYKWTKVLQCLELAKNDDDKNRMILNFASCTNKNWLGIPRPRAASKKINSRLKSQLRQYKVGDKCGIILMDFYDSDIIKTIITKGNMEGYSQNSNYF